MARGIVDLIQENKRRFYAGEIRNSFYEEPFETNENRRNTVIIDNSSSGRSQTSFWQNMKIQGQKFSEDFFYETVE